VLGEKEGMSGSDEEQTEQVGATPELSKKDKRRLKEAAKKAAMTHPMSLPTKKKDAYESDDGKGGKKKKAEKGDPALKCSICKV